MKGAGIAKITKGPGTATISDLARHWAVTPPTARKIVREAGLQDVGEVRARYRWIDIWKLEGEIYVPRADYAEMREPLLRIAQLAALDPRNKPASDRTMRRYASTGVLPVITLSPGLRRIRRAVFERAIQHV